MNWRGVRDVGPNNIKIMGIPEGEEKGRPTEFIAGLILIEVTWGEQLYEARDGGSGTSHPRAQTHGCQ